MRDAGRAPTPPRRAGLPTTQRSGHEGAALTRLRGAVAAGTPVESALDEDVAAVDARVAALLGDLGRVEFHGAGRVLQPLLDDPAVTDVLVNGDADVWVDRGRGLERDAGAAHRLATAGGARELAARLAATAGRRLDDASPVVDGSLPGGTRLHVVLPPLAPEGPLVSLRTRRRHAFHLADLVARGTVAPGLEPVLRALVERRANVLVSGSTGSGKTTLLAALLGLVPHDERIVVIEESAELAPDHPHVVHLQSRRANVQQAGEVGLTDLVRAALRMRPDRLVLGECRGAEVREVLGALNTGHEGGWATVHANTAQDVPARLVALGALAGMHRETVAAQAVSALDAVLHVRRDGGRRWVTAVGLLGEDFTCREALTVGPDGVVRPGSAWPVLAGRLALPDAPAARGEGVR